MAVSGVVAPRVVVRPPNVPAAPPISLLTQNNLDDTDATLIDQTSGPGRWEAGGGTTWLEPLRQFQVAQLWESWPDGSGAAAVTKSEINNSGSDPGIPAGLGAADQNPAQRPILATLIINEGLLTEWALQQSLGEMDIRGQMQRALDTVMPRVVERELWSAGEASLANWAQQFRLKTPNVVYCPNTTKLPYLRAIARAEQLAADYGFLDLFGGAFIHCSLELFGLVVAASHGVVRSPSGRQVSTMTGCQLVPELGGTGAWAEAGTSYISARPSGSPAGGNTSDGWLFVTPPVRVRLGAGGPARIIETDPSTTNDRTLLYERPFVIEAPVMTSHYTSIAVPVDYTTSGA